MTYFFLLDIKANNIMFGVADDSVFSSFEEEELQRPVSRKEVGDRIIYISRDLKMPKKVDAPILCDFGSAVPGDVEHTEDVQPDIYRAPEVILRVPWTYSIDIWNVGCMVRFIPSFLDHIITEVDTRFGMSSKAGRCSQAGIQSFKHIEVEPIWPR